MATRKQVTKVQDEQLEATALVADTGNKSAVIMPPLDAPRIDPTQPARSYKIAFSRSTDWVYSDDGGVTNNDSGQNAVAGSPLDLVMQISEASNGREGHDYRLRLAFTQQDGSLAELNINGVNRSQSGELYVGSAARSLIGALMQISDSVDDMQAFCYAAAFRLKRGRGKGMFIEVDIAQNDAWIAFSGHQQTLRAHKDVAGMVADLAMIKHRFRASGLLLTNASVTGAVEALEEAIPAEALASAGDAIEVEALPAEQADTADSQEA